MVSLDICDKKSHATALRTMSYTSYINKGLRLCTTYFLCKHEYAEKIVTTKHVNTHIYAER